MNTKYKEEPVAREEERDAEEKRAKSRWLLPLLLLLLIVLLLLTSWVLVMRIGEFAAVETNSIFLVPAEPGFSVEDQDQVWGTETRIDLFDTEYYGIGRDITVRSENGDRLIAPGTESEYTFNLKNTGNVAMDYSVSLDVALHMDGGEVSLAEFPLGVRLRHYSGEYLLGDGETWVSVAQLEDYLEEDTLAVNNYAWYTIEWKWLFEEDIIDDHDRLQLNVGDELDTLLGNISAESPVSLSVSISTVAVPSGNMNAAGGVDQYAGGDENGQAYANGEVGGRIRLWPFIILLLLLCTVAVAFGYQWKKEQARRKQEEEKREAEKQNHEKELEYIG